MQIANPVYTTAEERVINHVYACRLPDVHCIRLHQAAFPECGILTNGNHVHGKLRCVYLVTITAMSILLLREGNFQVLVILK